MGFWRRLFGLSPREEEIAERVHRLMEQAKDTGYHRKNREQVMREAIDSIFDGTFDRSKVEDALSKAEDD